MAVSPWSIVLQQCFLRRVAVDDFRKYLQTHSQQGDGRIIFQALLECRRSYCVQGDPLFSLYLNTLIILDFLKLSEALSVLIGRWNVLQKQQDLSKLKVLLSSEIRSVQDLTVSLVYPKYSNQTFEIRTCLLLTSSWLSAVVRSASKDRIDHSSSSLNDLIEALGFFLTSLCATPGGIQLLSQTEEPDNDKHNPRNPTEPRTSVKRATELCVSVFPGVTVQLVERLNAVLKHMSMFDGNDGQGEQSSDIQALQFQLNIVETQILPSRHATVAYLESLMYAGATVDDNVVLNYLAGRHNNNYLSMFLDLLLSSFQTLKVQQQEDKATLYQQQTRTFILNKLPTILLTISTSSFASFSTEQSIIQAWNQIASELSDQDLSMIGHHFLRVCSLNHLTSPETLTQLMGDSSPLSSEKGLSSKDDLLTQVQANHSKAPKLVEELMQTKGNAGSISQTLIETILMYCHAKETHHLKDLTDVIVRKPESINIIAMFIRPTYWLTPLCTLLDDWRWDEIHGESQPLYDEFGSLFLFILVCKNRLDLPISDLGIRNRDGFVLRYLETEGKEQTLEELNEMSQKCLGDWINALYISEGLSDELTTACSPQEFYNLVPTLLRQSVIAHQRGKLTEETLKAGLEYLLEPFLLPSLVSSLAWVFNILPQEPQVAALIFKVLVKASGTIEAKETYKTILDMSAEKFRGTSTQGIESDQFRILDEREHFSFAFTPDPSENIDSLQQKLVAQITSSSMTGQPNLKSTPAIVQAILRSKGPDAFLRCMVGILIQLSSGQDFLLSLDLIATIICTAGTSVRDILRIKYNRMGKLLQMNETLIAEATVHLHRRVETYAGFLIQSMDVNQFNTFNTITNINPDVVLESSHDQTTDMTAENQMEDLNQVLDEAAALGNIENDAGLSMDDLYGLQNDNMGLGNLDDLDLDYF